MPEKPTPQFFKEQKKRCPQCGGTLPCSTHGAEIVESQKEKVEMKLFQSETLYKAQQNERIIWVSVAPDGTNWSAVIEGENNIRANCINGVVEDWYDRVSSVKFSPSGHHVYGTRDAHSNIETSSAYKDGKRIDMKGHVLWPIYILDDGRIVARTKKKEENVSQHYLYVGDKIIAQRDYVIQGLSVSGNHYACVATKTLPNGEITNELIYDGEPKIQADDIDHVVLEDDGKTLAYVAYNRSKTAENTAQQEAIIYVNDEIYEQRLLDPNDEITEFRISKTGKRVTYRVSRDDASGNKTVSAYIDHEKAPYHFKTIVFSPNEENVLGIAPDYSSGVWRNILLLNGQEIIEEERMDSCGFLDNETWYALCNQGRDRWVVINNTEGERFSSVRTPQQSPDKKHIAYIAENKKDGAFSYYVVINHETKPLPFDKVDTILFSDDGSSLYVFGEENDAVVKKTYRLDKKTEEDIKNVPSRKIY